MDNEFYDHFVSGLGRGKEDYRRTAELARELRGEQGLDAPKLEQVLDQNPNISRVMRATGMDPNAASKEMAEKDMGIGMPPADKPVARFAHIAGNIGGDLVQDYSRSLWWLLNAPQAVANVATEQAVKSVNPYMWSAERTNVQAIPDNDDLAVAKGLLSPEFRKPMPGVGLEKNADGRTYYTKRIRQPGHIEMLGIPTGIATNTAMGLMTPFGGAPGYEAVVPSAEDPSKTSNILAEVAAKYILGRTGNLLPYDEFSKVRPDVSPEEYRRYKAFKYDKNIDLDITDGDVTLPAGIAKFTTEGIHGPELQFLGRSLPVTTGFVPFAGALAGTMAGARYNPAEGRQGPYVKRGLLGGLAGLAGGTIVGNLIERERQRRNSVANNINTRPLDPESDYSAY
jgi:hypothetical protein